MIGIIYGGSGSGKSAFAENLAVRLCRGPLIYLATMAAGDAESKNRILRHRRLRSGKGFQTEERYVRLEDWKLPDRATVLLECLSNLTANEMFLPEGRRKEPLAAVLAGLSHLAEQADSLIVVSNDVFGDGLRYEGETETYLKVMAGAGAWLAEKADLVVESVHGVPVWWKGSEKQIADERREGGGLMQLVTGGAYQGKLDFARTLAGKSSPVIWEGENGAAEDWRQVDILSHFPAMIRRLLVEGADAEAAVERMIKENQELVVVTEEIGCGLVPMDAFDRKFRETAGRLSCRLAGQAKDVYRVACGLAQKIK